MNIWKTQEDKTKYFFTVGWLWNSFEVYSICRFSKIVYPTRNIFLAFYMIIESLKTGGIERIYK